MGTGCTIVFLGGLMMRFPMSSFGVVTGPAMVAAEKFVAEYKAKRPAADEQAAMSAREKVCPQCAEMVKHDARKCRFCNYLFE